MLLLLICKFFMLLLHESTCIIILYLEVFLNIILMKFYFPLGLMVVHKLLKVVFQTSRTLRMEVVVVGISFCIRCFFCCTWHFPVVLKVFKRKKNVLAVLIICFEKEEESMPAKLFADLRI